MLPACYNDMEKSKFKDIVFYSLYLKRKLQFSWEIQMDLQPGEAACTDAYSQRLKIEEGSGGIGGKSTSFLSPMFTAIRDLIARSGPGSKSTCLY